MNAAQTVLRLVLLCSVVLTQVAAGLPQSTIGRRWLKRTDLGSPIWNHYFGQNISNWDSRNVDLMNNAALSVSNMYAADYVYGTMHSLGFDPVNGTLSPMQETTGLALDVWKAFLNGTENVGRKRLFGTVVRNNATGFVYASQVGQTQPGIFVFQPNTAGVLSQIQLLPGAGTDIVDTSSLVLATHINQLISASGLSTRATTACDHKIRAHTIASDGTLSVGFDFTVGEPVTSMTYMGGATLESFVAVAQPNYGCNVVAANTARLSVYRAIPTAFAQVQSLNVVCVSSGSNPCYLTNLRVEGLYLYASQNRDSQQPNTISVWEISSIFQLTHVQTFVATPRDDFALEIVNSAPTTSNAKPPEIKSLCALSEWVLATMEFEKPEPSTAAGTSTAPLYWNRLLVFGRNTTSGRIDFHSAEQSNERLSGLTCSETWAIASSTHGLVPFELRHALMPPGSISYSGVDNNVGTLVKNHAYSLVPQRTTQLGDLPSIWAISPDLPSNLHLNTITGVIEGTPNVTLATQVFSVIYTNNRRSGVTSLSLTIVEDSSECVYSTSSERFTLSQLVNITAPSVPANTEFKFTVSPALPLGMVLNQDGSVSGYALTKVVKTTFMFHCITSNSTTSRPIFIEVTDPPRGIRYDTTHAIYVANHSINTNYLLYSGQDVVAFTVSPSLPPGLMLNPKTGAISGTPTTLQTVDVAYNVTGNITSGQYSSVEITIKVVREPPTNLFYSSTSEEYVFGIEIFPTAPRYVGIVELWEVSPPLPAGLSLNSTGGITGVPTEVVSQKGYRITAINSGGNISTTLFLTVHRFRQVPQDLTYTYLRATFTKGVAIPANTPVINNTGGVGWPTRANLTWTVVPSLPNGIIFNTSTGVIDGVPTEESLIAGYRVQAVDELQSAVMSVSVFFEVVAVAPRQLIYTPTVLVFIANLTVSDCLVTPKAPAVLYNRTIQPHDVSVTYGVFPPLPNGMTIDAATGCFTGKPTVLQTTKYFTVYATNTGGSTSVAIAVKVVDAIPISISLGGTQQELLTIGAPVSFGVPVFLTDPNVAPIREWSVTPDLPQGLSVDPVSGVIAGEPIVPSSETLYTLTAANTGGSFSRTFNLSVEAYISDPKALYYDNIDAHYYLGRPIIPNHVTSGFQPPFSSTPALPAGLLLNETTGLITGAPTARLPRTAFRVQSAQDSEIIYITVTHAPPEGSVYYIEPVTFQRRQPVLLQMFGVPKTSVVTNTSVFPALPEGIDFDPRNGSAELRGQITNTTELGTKQYIVTVSNDGGSLSGTIEITIVDRPPRITYTNPIYVQAQSNCSVHPHCEYAAPISTGGAVVRYELGTALPEGLLLNETSGVVYGQAVNTAVAKLYKVTAFNTGGSDSAFLFLEVNTLGVKRPLPGTFVENSEKRSEFYSIIALSLILMSAIVALFLFLSWRARHKKNTFDTVTEAIGWRAFQSAVVSSELKERKTLERQNDEAEADARALIPRSVRKLFERLSINTDYAKAFTRQRIHVADLVHLTEEELERLLPPLNSRKRLLDWIYQTLIPATQDVRERDWVKGNNKFPKGVRRNQADQAVISYPSLSAAEAPPLERSSESSYSDSLDPSSGASDSGSTSESDNDAKPVRRHRKVV